MFRVRPENVRFDGNSATRVASIVVVAVVHLAAFVFVSLPATPLRRIRTATMPAAGNDLVVRLLEVHAPTGSVHAKRPAERRSALRRSTRHDARHQKHVAARVAPDAKVHRDEKKATRPLDLSLPGTNHAEPVVGRTLGRARPEPHFRLPGGGHVHGAPHLHLVDPRTQGVAGLVRGLQSLLGVVNPHCIEVDSWRGMTREQRLRRHLTDEAVAHVAERYGCLPPRRHGGPPLVSPGR